MSANRFRAAGLRVPFCCAKPQLLGGLMLLIISGRGNISSLEVEEILYQHPDRMEAAVVAARGP